MRLIRWFSVILALLGGPCAGAVELSSAELARATVIDVRTPEEYAAGHVDGAILIPHSQIGDRIAGVVADKSAPLVLYCRSGRRAEMAAEVLRMQGYTRVQNLGGLDAARQALGAAKSVK